MAACNPINELFVQVLDKPGPDAKETEGFQFIPVNINLGAGGKYIYIGYKRGTDQAITSIDFRAYDVEQKSDPEPKPGQTWHPQDLNDGAGGKYIYMFSSFSGNEGDILNITVGETEANTAPNIGDDWKADTLDLNQGAGGKFIWFYSIRNLEK